MSGGVLRIPPGTELHGVSGAHLHVQQGGRIYSEGTATDPVVFTSWREPGQRQPDDWQGITILGRAPCLQITGCSDDAGPYGGNDPDDSSGRLVYTHS